MFPYLGNTYPNDMCSPTQETFISCDMCSHRRTGNFLPGGGGKPFAQKKISKVAQIFTKESERKESRITTTYAILAYEDGLIQLVFRVNTKFEYKLSRHKQAFGKIATTVVLR